MNIFRKIKGNVRRIAKTAATPEGMVYFRGEYVPLFTTEAELPDDFHTLELMAKYYGQGHSSDLQNRDEYYRIILRRLYPMVQEGKGEDKYGWIQKDYFVKAAPQDEMDKYHFERFCRNVENAFLTEESLKDGRKDIYVSGVFDSYSFKKSMPYFEKHLPEIIHSVCVLLEKEKRPTSVLHMGYYMYQDLLDYLKNDDPLKQFSFAGIKYDKHYLWKKSYTYMRSAYEFYNTAISSPDRMDSVAVNEAWAKLSRADTDAKYNMEYCSENNLMAVYNASINGTMETRRERKVRLEKRAENNDVSAQLALAKDYFYGTGANIPRTDMAYKLFMKAAMAGSGEAMYYLGLYYENGHPPVVKDASKAEDYFFDAMEQDYTEAFIHVADREYAAHRNKDMAAKYYKKALPKISEKENPKKYKTIIARIIACSNTTDITEDTLGLYALAADYARLDAPIVKEEDLLSLLADVEKGRYAALEKLEFYYTYYSRGRAAMGTIKGSDIFETDPERAYEMRDVASGFRLMKIAMLLPLAKQDPEYYLDELAGAYLDRGNYKKAKEYTELGLRMNILAVMYFAYQKARKLDYDDDEAMYYLQRAAAMGHKGAIGALEYLGILEESRRERAAWVAANKPKPKSRRDYASELELMERSIDMMLGGSGYSLDENALTGKMDFAQASLLRHYKNKLLDNLVDE